MRTCSKLGYASYSEAEKVAKRMRRNLDDQIQAFRCPYCPWFHVGHNPEEAVHQLRQFKRRRRALYEADHDYLLAS